YTGQCDLNFALHAGHGEFPRLVVSPGDAEEAYYWACLSMNLSWKYQIPVILLSDKTLCEGTYSFDIDSIPEIEEENPIFWDRKGSYKRYLNTEEGVSPLAFVPDKEAIIKVNSYEHDEFGVTTEEPEITEMMREKRMRKEKFLLQELEEKFNPVKVYGNRNSELALLCWGSNKGVCIEVGKNLGLKVIQPVVLWPFSVRNFKDSLKGVKKLIAVECNSTGQLVRLINSLGFNVDEKILKYDGRPFSLEELENKLKKLI
ncbi:MAG: pyruvate ferredoxin oxidoreductase, partial [Candidatus Omnitrophica bacterium]|nr:pyruvate ferredoxin oxidoreductase [Candidatus Omnitrophota bacterium]